MQRENYSFAVNCAEQSISGGWKIPIVLRELALDKHPRCELKKRFKDVVKDKLKKLLKLVPKTGKKAKNMYDWGK